jgi:hypothetical protein
VSKRKLPRLIPLESLASQVVNIRDRIKRGEDLVTGHCEILTEAADFIAEAVAERRAREKGGA